MNGRLRATKPRKVKTVKVNSDLDPTCVINCQGPWLTSGWDTPPGGGSGASVASGVPVVHGTGRCGDKPREHGLGMGTWGSASHGSTRRLPGSPALPGGSRGPQLPLLLTESPAPSPPVEALPPQGREKPGRARVPGPAEALWVERVPSFCVQTRGSKRTKPHRGHTSAMKLKSQEPQCPQSTPPFQFAPCSHTEQARHPKPSSGWVFTLSREMDTSGFFPQPHAGSWY